MPEMVSRGIVHSQDHQGLIVLKVYTSFGNAPLTKYKMEALITNHVKEYVLTNT